MIPSLGVHAADACLPNPAGYVSRIDSPIESKPNKLK